MKQLWKWQCQTCGNSGLFNWDEGRPRRCRDGCKKPDFKLLKMQENCRVNANGTLGDDWIHPLGEV